MKGYKTRVLSFLLVAALLTGLAAYVVQPVSAEDPPEDEQFGGNQKVLVINLKPGSIVSQYFDVPPLGVLPAGGAAGSRTAEVGGTMELYAPVGRSSSFVVTDPDGSSRLIGIVWPHSAGPDVVLDANNLQYANLFQDRGLASPLTPGQGQSGAQNNNAMSGASN